MGLPSGYKQVEYIESSGTQYIDTGLTVNKSDSYEYILSAYITNAAWGGANGYMQFNSEYSLNKLTEFRVVYNGSTGIENIYVDNNLHTTNNWANSYSGVNVKIGLLKMGDAGNAWYSGNPQIGKIYSCKIYKSGTLVRDFVPCINSSGAVGLYDTVNGTFHGNSGSGVFTAGNVVETGLPGRVNIGGAWKTLTKGYVNVGGIWKPIVAGYVNVNGVWKLLWKAEKEILYTWKKYSVKTTTGAPYTHAVGMTTIKTYAKGTALRTANNYTFDANTGKFTLSSPVTVSVTTISYKYFMLNATTSSEMYRYYSKSTSSDSVTITCAPFNVSATTTKSQGDYISDVTSSDESAYPDNGVHTDGYWYVKQ